MGAIATIAEETAPPDKLIEQAKEYVARYQPELRVTVWKSLVCIDGKYILTGPLGEYDSFEVKIAVPANFPEDEPVVFETGGRIERVLDRHIFEKHGNCCVGVYEEWLLLSDNCSLEEYFLGPVDDYFFSQHWYETKLAQTGKGEWPLGERSHGLKGELEAFGEILGLEPDAKLIADHLKVLCKNPIKGHLSCPCGSGKRIRNCHRERIDQIRRAVNPAMARRMLDRIESRVGKPRK